jgi:exosortase/archaeosortase family protein
MIIDQIKQEYRQIPGPVKIFLIRAAIILISWNLLYSAYLKPANIPDQQLTNITVNATRTFLSIFYNNTAVIQDPYKPLITIGNHKIIGVAPNCNGLELMVLYAGFIFCFPTSNKRMLKFLFFGLIAIFILNVLRCSAIAWLNINYKHWVDFGHKIAFKVMMYSLIFYIWVLYTKNYFNLLKQKSAK